jgi:hypothetical protein
MVVQVCLARVGQFGFVGDQVVAAQGVGLQLLAEGPGRNFSRLSTRCCFCITTASGPRPPRASRNFEVEGQVV